MGRPRTPPELVVAMMERRRDYQKKYERERVELNPVAMEMLRSAGHVRAPDEVLAERERRLSAPETPNTIILGDPLTPRWNSNA